MSIRLNKEQKEKVEDLTAIKEYINSIVVSLTNRSGRALMQEILPDIQPLLMKAGLEDVSKSLEVDHYDFAKKISPFQKEIIYAIDEKIESFDPGCRHKLFSKKIQEMTGYEYEKYLSLLN